jgi:tetratricopeptide (TPR) repeat protein
LLAADRELSVFYWEDGGDRVLSYLPLYRLGEFYLMAGDPESAYKVKKSVADGLAEVLGKRNPLTLRAMSTLTLDSIITGRMRDAEKTYREISRIQLEVVGEDYPDGYESLLYVALAQYSMTNFEESASTSAQSQASLFRLLGPRHNLFLTGQLFNAYDIAELGRLEEARYMLDYIYEYRVSILGPDNAMALMAQVALGQVFRKLEDFQKAEHHLEQAFEARQRIWGLTIFSSVDTAIHLIILYREMGRPKDAQRYIDIISKPGRSGLYFERHCQVEHLRALLLIDDGQFEKAQEILQSILDRSSDLGRETNNRALLWVRLTLATILRDSDKKDKASMLFTEIVTEDYSTDDEASSLVEEPEPPRVLQIAEDGLRLVRRRKHREAQALLRENGLKWVREDDFWLQTGGPAADTAWMKGP